MDQFAVNTGENFAVSISFSAQIKHAGMIRDLMTRLGVGKSDVCQVAIERYYESINQAEAKTEAEPAG